MTKSDLLALVIGAVVGFGAMGLPVVLWKFRKRIGAALIGLWTLNELVQRVAALEANPTRPDDLTVEGHSGAYIGKLGGVLSFFCPVCQPEKWIPLPRLEDDHSKPGTCPACRFNSEPAWGTSPPEEPKSKSGWRR